MARKLLITRERDARAIAKALSEEYAPYVIRPDKPGRARLWRLAIYAADGSTFLAWAEA